MDLPTQIRALLTLPGYFRPTKIWDLLVIYKKELVADAPKSRTPVRCNSPHFPVFREFNEASYLRRYDLLCQKLTLEQLYTTASVIATPRNAIKNGEFTNLSPMTDIKTFVTTLAGHIASVVARLN